MVKYKLSNRDLGIIRTSCYQCIICGKLWKSKNFAIKCCEQDKRISKKHLGGNGFPPTN